ncbi:hypothetical protein Cme02nite_38440 [Catellatospora methionotrophica]|uniref:Uncharacterized protein n=1 Tax=Catellatospora methionotrophica TaxID=121620 RepID=A0A8J3PFS1_9ACTN|nr:hypothetical protein [Catellatospora methionotrophica]GIG15512.1 hypothetical protein Cme02nite_38440 [Catellatospora methionotrophica]
MGYTTDFEGTVAIDPPLNPAEIEFLREFARSRRMNRPDGPYSTRDYSYGELGGTDYNRCAEGQPSLWCDWEPTADGRGIEWNGMEKFHDAHIWMAYLIDNFLKDGGHAQGQIGFEDFTFDHHLNGVIKAQGEDPNDAWDLIVGANRVGRVDR